MFCMRHRQSLAMFALLLLSCVTSGAAGVTGTWTGVMDSPIKVGVRFVLEESNGKLSGRTYWEDPKTLVFEPEGAISGIHTASAASWTTEGDVAVEGKFEGNTFVGTISFPAQDDEPAHSTSLTLSR